MARSCELVATVAFCTLLCLALLMLTMYWAASAAPLHDFGRVIWDLH